MNESKYNLTEKVVIYIITSLVGLIIMFCAILMAAGVCLACDLPESFSPTLSVVSMGIGTFFAGFLSAKKIKSSGILNGAATGGIIYLLIFFISLILSNSGFSMITVYHLLIAVLSGAIGGIIGVNSLSRKRLI